MCASFWMTGIEKKKKELLYISDVEKPYSRGADMKLVVVEFRLDDNISTVKEDTNSKNISKTSLKDNRNNILMNYCDDKWMNKCAVLR